MQNVKHCEKESQCFIDDKGNNQYITNCLVKSEESHLILLILFYTIVTFNYAINLLQHNTNALSTTLSNRNLLIIQIDTDNLSQSPSILLLLF